MIALALVIGAGLGAPLRFLIDQWVTSRVTGPGWRQAPWGLFVVNLLGSSIAGVAVTLASAEWRMALLVGFAGTFTTFSGFAWDADRLWGTHRPAFWTTVIAMPIACVVAFSLARAVASMATGG